MRCFPILNPMIGIWDYKGQIITIVHLYILHSNRLRQKPAADNPVRIMPGHRLLQPFFFSYSYFNFALSKIKYSNHPKGVYSIRTGK